MDRKDGGDILGCPQCPERSRLAVLFAFLPLWMAGCFGPAAVRQTRLRYNDAIQQTNHEELLLNLVRLRDEEHPSFLPITGLNAQFELNSSASFRSGAERGGTDNWGGGLFGFADRPTLTFAPQRPPEMTRALLSQVSLDTLYLFSRRTGDVDRVFRLFTRTINGVDNAPTGGGAVPHDPPVFAEFRALSGRFQALGAQGIAILTTQDRVADVPDAVDVDRVDARDLVEIKKAGFGVRSNDPATGYRLIQTKPVRVLQVQPEAASSPLFLDVAAMLRLVPYATAYPVEEAPDGQLPPSPAEGPREKITVTTRSILEVMYLLSKTVAVPEEHCREGVARLTINPDGSPFDWGLVTGDLFRVCVSRHCPKGAWVAVKYRGYWFYVDDRDASSKCTMNLFSELLRLQRIGGVEGQPLLSLPLGP